MERRSRRLRPWRPNWLAFPRAACWPIATRSIANGAKACRMACSGKAWQVFQSSNQRPRPARHDLPAALAAMEVLIPEERGHDMTTTYLDLILRGARAYPARIAVTAGSENLSFAQVDTLSSQLAHALMAYGIQPGARVALLLNNGIRSVPVDFACVKAGIIRVPLNSRLS